jgi:hypothetical protein
VVGPEKSLLFPLNNDLSFVGGGTIIPWALIPAAAICNVDPFELARRNVIPVITGLIVTTIVAMFLI